MQSFVVLMGILILVGTVMDIIHKKNVKYFFQNAKKAKLSAKKELTTSERISVISKTIASDIATTSELGAGKRRLAHVMGMYGTILFWVGSVVMIFFYTSPNSVTPAFWPIIWHLGAALTVLGGGWFWFFKSRRLLRSSTLVQNYSSRFVCISINSIFFVWINMVISSISKLTRKMGRYYFFRIIYNCKFSFIWRCILV